MNPSVDGPTFGTHSPLPKREQTMSSIYLRKLINFTAQKSLNTRSTSKTCAKTKRKHPAEPKEDEKNDKDSKRSKLDETEPGNSIDTNETSERSNQNSDDDSDWDPHMVSVVNDSSDSESDSSTLPHSNDKHTKTIKQTQKKKDTTSKTDSEMDKNNETTGKDKIDDKGYEEWIRQKNLAARFFGLGPPRKSATEKSNIKSKDIEKDKKNKNSLGNIEMESSKQNQVPASSLKTPDETGDVVTDNADVQVTPANEDIDNNGPLSCVKITSVCGGVVEDVDAARDPVASIHVNAVFNQKTHNASAISENLKKSISLTSSKSPSNFESVFGEMHSGVATPQMTSKQLPSPARPTSSSISGLISSGPSGNRVIVRGKIATDYLTAPTIASCMSSVTTTRMCESSKSLLTPKVVTPISSSSILIPQSIGTFLNIPSSVVSVPKPANVISEGVVPNIVINPTVPINVAPALSASVLGPAGPVGLTNLLMYSQNITNQPIIQNPINTSTIVGVQTNSISLQPTYNVNSNCTLSPSTVYSCTPVTTSSAVPGFSNSVMIPSPAVNRQSGSCFVPQKLSFPNTVTVTTSSGTAGRPTDPAVTLKGLSMPCTVVSKPPVRSNNPTSVLSSNSVMMKTTSSNNTIKSGSTVVTDVSGPHTSAAVNVSSPAAAVSAVNTISRPAAIKLLAPDKIPTIVSGVTPSGRVIRGVREVSRGAATGAAISRMLNAAMTAAEQKLKTIKDLSNVELKINLQGDLPMISIKNNKVSKRLFRLQRIETGTPETGMQEAQAGTAATEIQQQKETVENNSEEETGTKVILKDVAPTTVDSDSDVEVVSVLLRSIWHFIYRTLNKPALDPRQLSSRSSIMQTRSWPIAALRVCYQSTLAVWENSGPNHSSNVIVVCLFLKMIWMSRSRPSTRTRARSPSGGGRC